MNKQTTTAKSFFPQEMLEEPSSDDKAALQDVFAGMILKEMEEVRAEETVKNIQITIGENLEWFQQT